MKDLKNWREVTKGLYRYVIGANCAYEIHVIVWYHDTDILTASASLYIVGEWDEANRTCTKRECLMLEQPLFECLNKAVEDFDDNVEVEE